MKWVEFSECKKYVKIVLNEENENSNENDIQKLTSNLWNLDNNTINESTNNNNNNLDSINLEENIVNV